MLENIAQYEDNSPQGDAHSIRKVADDLNTSLNTINIVLTGEMGSGKTFYIMNEVIPISQLPSVHLVLFVGRKDHDPTVKATIPLLGCPIKFTDYEDAEEDIIEIFEAKRCYNYLRGELEANGWLESWRDHFNEENFEKLEDKVFEELKVSDFSLPYLDTIIIFDDVGSSNLFRKNTYIFT
jgi:hypothetical protein